MEARQRTWPFVLPDARRKPPSRAAREGNTSFQACSTETAERVPKTIWDLCRLVSVDVSMNTTRPLRMVLPITRKGLRLKGDAMNPDKLEDKLQKYEQIKDLAAMRHYEGWQHDCAKMPDLL